MSKTFLCVPGATSVPSLAALPFLNTLAHSERGTDRAAFVRVYCDYAALLREQRDDIPRDWREALQRCLDKARPTERGFHKATLALSEKLFDWRRDAVAAQPIPAKPELARVEGQPSETQAALRPTGASKQEAPAGIKREDIAGLLADGDLDALIAMASNPLARLRTEDIAPLVQRARLAMETAGDARLAQAILARHPIRLEMAPLFMAATSDQRWAIMLAAQRAELGRRNPHAFATVGREAIARLEYAAIAGSPEQFQDLLARAIGAPLDLAARIAADPSGEALVMALVAIGAPTDVCVRVLTASDMRDRGRFPRVHALSRLSGSASPLAARRILAAIVGGQNYQEAGASPQSPTPRRPRGFSTVQPAAPRWLQPRNVNTVGAK
jgi:hypothetical protein